MFRSRAARRLLTCTALTLATAGFDDYARAQDKLETAYLISFSRIRVGDITATLAFGDSDYTISAHVRAGGIMKLLVEGEGSFTTRGTVKNGHPMAANFMSRIVSNRATFDVEMVLDDGTVKELMAEPPSPTSGIVPISEADRQAVVDPLTAMLFSVSSSEGLAPEACRRTLPIFDGRERYDLKLAFKRTDHVVAKKGYAGPVVVCSVQYDPIAGHRASAPLVKYLSEGRDMEVALAPAPGMHLLAPFRVSVTGRVANLVIVANRFETTARSQTVTDPK